MTICNKLHNFDLNRCNSSVMSNTGDSYSRSSNQNVVIGAHYVFQEAQTVDMLHDCSKNKWRRGGLLKKMSSVVASQLAMQLAIKVVMQLQIDRNSKKFKCFISEKKDGNVLLTLPSFSAVKATLHLHVFDVKLTGNIALNQQICIWVNEEDEDDFFFFAFVISIVLSLWVALPVCMALKLCLCIIALTAVSFMPLPVTHVMLSNVELLCKSYLYNLRSRSVLYVQCCSGRRTHLQ